MEFTKDSLDVEFPSRKHGIQFNHAAVAPLPKRAAEAMTGYARSLSETGALDWLDWGRKADELRGLAATLVGSRPESGGGDDIAIIPNTTHGLTYVAHGFPWESGDEVITTHSEFPANLTPWLSLVRRGVTVKRVITRNGAFTVEDVEALMTSRTRLVSVSLVSFHTGFRAPVEALGKLCQQRGIIFGLDGIQGLGVVPVDVEGWNVSFLSADGHKWLLGPEGCGLLYTSKSFRQQLVAPPGWTNVARPFGIIGVDEIPGYRTDGRRFENGAPPTAGVYALAASLQLILETGLPEIQERVSKVMRVLIQGLPALGFSPLLFDSSPHAGILAARPPEGKDARYFSSRLDEKRIATSAREGFLRLSPHFGNDEDEAERLLFELKGTL
jgi:selenocysteine lyase/cysteine desulfurase